MKIAFDVLGTLKGSKGKDLAKAFVKLQSMGHECVVWSSLYSYTLDAKNMHGLNCDTMTKASKSEMREFEKPLFDVAIDDDTQQTYLGAKKFVWVHELPSNADEIVSLILSRANEPMTKEESEYL